MIYIELQFYRECLQNNVLATLSIKKIHMMGSLNVPEVITPKSTLVTNNKLGGELQISESIVTPYLHGTG